MWHYRVVAITGYFSIPVFGYSEYDSSTGLVLIRIFSMFIVTIFTNLKNIKNDISVPNLYWFSTTFVSLASLKIDYDDKFFNVTVVLPV